MNIWQRICVCACVRMHTCVYTHAHGGQRTISAVISQALCTLSCYFGNGLSLACSLQSWLCWLVSELQVSIYLCLQGWDLQMCVPVQFCLDGFWRANPGPCVPNELSMQLQGELCQVAIKRQSTKLQIPVFVVLIYLCTATQKILWEETSLDLGRMEATTLPANTMP